MSDECASKSLQIWTTWKMCSDWGCFSEVFGNIQIAIFFFLKSYLVISGFDHVCNEKMLDGNAI